MNSANRKSCVQIRRCVLHLRRFNLYSYLLRIFNLYLYFICFSHGVVSKNFLSVRLIFVVPCRYLQRYKATSQKTKIANQLYFVLFSVMYVASFNKKQRIIYVLKKIQYISLLLGLCNAQVIYSFSTSKLTRRFIIPKSL